jgi:hypothetical protein
MSFIYEDKKLVELLKRAGDDFKIKYGQVAPPVVDPNAYAAGAALATRLQRSIDPSNAPVKNTTIGTEDGSEPGLNAQNLKSLTDFLQWASDNKITWNGKRVAWSTDANTLTRPAGTPDDAWVFRDRGKAAYASKPELIALLSHLRDSNEASGNRVFQAGMTKIIGEANQSLVRENESPLETQPKPQAQKTQPGVGLDSEAIIDGFDSDILDEADPYRSIMAFPLFPTLTKNLKVKDLSSSGSFLSWLRDMKIKTKTGTFSVVDPKGNPCAAVHILYQRAHWLSQYAASAEKAVPNYGKMVALYAQKIAEYGRQLTGPDGKPCAVEAPGTAAAAGTQTGSNNVELMSRLVSVAPLKMRDISFSRIKDFFSQYQQIVGSERGANVQAAINNANTAMAQVQAPNSMLSNSMDIFSLSASPGEVKTWLAPPEGKHYLALLSHLKSVLSNTAYVLRDMQDTYEDRLDNNAKNVLAQQVGSGVGSGSIYGNNWNQLTRLESAVKL